MALVCRSNAWDPFRDLVAVQEEMNRVFNRSLAPAGRTTPADGAQWWPGVDIAEEKDKILVRADVPGLKQEEIEVSVADDLLTIEGERKRELETKEGQTHRIERSYGTFARSFSLPSSVDTGKVGASYKNGVLEITLPKRQEVLPKQVKVDIN